MLKSPLRVTLYFSSDDDDMLVDWFDGTRVKELYAASLAVVVMVVLADKLVAVVASVGCRIVGVIMMIIRRAMTTTEPVLAIQYWPVLHSCHLLLNILC